MFIFYVIYQKYVQDPNKKLSDKHKICKIIMNMVTR